MIFQVVSLILLVFLTATSLRFAVPFFNVQASAKHLLLSTSPAPHPIGAYLVHLLPFVPSLLILHNQDLLPLPTATIQVVRGRQVLAVQVEA